jgi:hypothetical protein
VINVSNPGGSAGTAEFDVLGDAREVEVVGSLAYVAAGNRGLRILDLTNPLAPVVLGTYQDSAGGYAYGLDVVGTTAYIAFGSRGLQAINVATPSSPAWSYTVATSNAQDVKVSGGLALVANGSAGLAVVDLATRTIRGAYDYDTLGFGYDVEWLPSGAALLADGNNGVFVVNPGATPPTLIRRYDTATARDIEVAGTLAYVADGTAGLLVLDMSNPAVAVVPLGAYNTPGSATGVEIRGSKAFVADGAGGVQVIDIANAAAPRWLGTYATRGSTSDVAFAGGGAGPQVALIADSDGGVQSVQWSDDAPAWTGALNPAGASHSDVEVAGSLAVVADGANGVRLLDVADPASPRLLGVFTTAGLVAWDVEVRRDVASVVNGVERRRDLVFVADLSRRFLVLDVTDPQAPSLLAWVATSGDAYDVDIAGDLAFVTDSTRGLLVFDIADPARPALLGSASALGSPRDVEVAGQLAFVAGYGGGLSIIDVSDARHPTRAGTYDRLGIGAAYDVALAGNLAVVADQAGGVLVIDVSDPAAPRLVGTFDTPAVRTTSRSWARSPLSPTRPPV